MLPRLSTPSPACRFGAFELDVEAGELRRDGRRLRLQPQPFKLLALLVNQAGRIVTREEIRRELWPDGTFVDFDQAVNFAIRQIRDALGDAADSPLYVETVPKRGYRFIAPLQQAGQAELPQPRATTARLQKAIWTNIAELRASEARRHRTMTVGFVALGTVIVLLVVLLLLRG